MAASRLTYAIEAGALNLPDIGDIALFRPRADCDISVLEKDRIEIIQGNFPDYHSFEERGYRVAVSPNATYAAAIVFLPRAKAHGRALIAQALALTGGGPVVVDGLKTDGADSMLKECRKRGAEIGEVVAKSHGKIFTISGGDFSDWSAQDRQLVDGGFLTSAGVFSADGVDKGSAALVWALPAKMTGKVADLGAGWGYLSHHVLQRADVTACHLVEAEYDALQCARANITDPRAHFHWEDALTFNAETGFDHIVCNPPFHTGRAADPDLGRRFIQAAARLIARHGILWLVANRHLPYEQNLLAAFHEVSEVAGDASFKVFRAAKPQLKKRN